MLNSILGIAFLAVGTAATLLMYHLWGYSFDHATMKSAAPPRLMRLHRFLGWTYACIYVYLMVQMVPRLWGYQVEFPARTVAHLLIGMAIGAILIIKILVVRFFKHLEGTMIPFLGTTLLVMTVLLLGLSVPFSLRETVLSRSAPGGTVFSAENMQRVATLLPTANLPADAPLAELGSVGGLTRGRGLLLDKCIQCHDLRTVLARPRTPEDWTATVRRMGDRSTVFAPISDAEQWHVTAYLIAISPDLQKTAQEMRGRRMARSDAKDAAERMGMSPEMPANPATLPAMPATGPAAPGNASMAGMFNLAGAQKIFETRCVQCHSLGKVTKHPPKNGSDVMSLVGRMVDNGMDASDEDLRQISFYLRATFVK